MGAGGSGTRPDADDVGLSDGVNAEVDALLAVERVRLGRAARARAVELRWDRTAAAMLDVLVADAIGRAPPG